jgi:hypothetical protein
VGYVLRCECLVRCELEHGAIGRGRAGICRANELAGSGPSAVEVAGGGRAIVVIKQYARIAGLQGPAWARHGGGAGAVSAPPAADAQGPGCGRRRPQPPGAALHAGTQQRTAGWARVQAGSLVASGRGGAWGASEAASRDELVYMCGTWPCVCGGHDAVRCGYVCVRVGAPACCTLVRSRGTGCDWPWARGNLRLPRGRAKTISLVVTLWGSNVSSWSPGPGESPDRAISDSGAGTGSGRSRSRAPPGRSGGVPGGVGTLVLLFRRPAQPVVYCVAASLPPCVLRPGS